MTISLCAGPNRRSVVNERVTRSRVSDPPRRNKDEEEEEEEESDLPDPQAVALSDALPRRGDGARSGQRRYANYYYERIADCTCRGKSQSIDRDETSRNLNEGWQPVREAHRGSLPPSRVESREQEETLNCDHRCEDISPEQFRKRLAP